MKESPSQSHTVSSSSSISSQPQLQPVSVISVVSLVLHSLDPEGSLPPPQGSDLRSRSRPAGAAGSRRGEARREGNQSIDRSIETAGTDARPPRPVGRLFSRSFISFCSGRFLAASSAVSSFLLRFFSLPELCIYCLRVESFAVPVHHKSNPQTVLIFSKVVYVVRRLITSSLLG